MSTYFHHNDWPYTGIHHRHIKICVSMVLTALMHTIRLENFITLVYKFYRLHICYKFFYENSNIIIYKNIIFNYSRSLRHIIFPSTHKPLGNGFIWPTKSDMFEVLGDKQFKM